MKNTILIITWSLVCIWIGLTLGLYAELKRDKIQCQNENIQTLIIEEV